MSLAPHVAVEQVLRVSHSLILEEEGLFLSRVDAVNASFIHFLGYLQEFEFCFAESNSAGEDVYMFYV